MTASEIRPPSVPSPSPDDFVFRDAVGEWAGVGSSLVAEGTDRTAPVASIVIMTFQRHHFLLEAVAGAVRQRFARPYEIVVVDNDPESDGHERVLAAFPELRERSFRYFRNDRNLGMFGNFNRCIELARAEWMTILHDDDLLSDDFLALTLSVVGSRPSTDGVVSRKAFMNQRRTELTELPGVRFRSWPPGTVTTGSALRRVGESAAARREVIVRAVSRLVLEYGFLGRASRRLRPSKLFWGPTLGNTSGFIFRRRAALEIGGFYAEEFPASDLFFFARFARLYHLRQHRAPAAVYRIAENESAKPDTCRGAIKWIHDLQRIMAGRDVPRWWLRLAPMVVARYQREYRDLWDVDLSTAELEALLGVRVPRHRPYLLWIARMSLRGY